MKIAVNPDRHTENERLKRDMDTLKKQSAANNAEYDRLAEEASKLQVGGAAFDMFFLRIF